MLYHIAKKCLCLVLSMAVLCSSLPLHAFTSGLDESRMEFIVTMTEAEYNNMKLMLHDEIGLLKDYIDNSIGREIGFNITGEELRKIYGNDYKNLIQGISDNRRLIVVERYQAIVKNSKGDIIKTWTRGKTVFAPSANPYTLARFYDFNSSEGQEFIKRKIEQSNQAFVQKMSVTERKALFESRITGFRKIVYNLEKKLQTKYPRFAGVFFKRTLAQDAAWWASMRAIGEERALARAGVAGLIAVTATMLMLLVASECSGTEITNTQAGKAQQLADQKKLQAINQKVQKNLSANEKKLVTDFGQVLLSYLDPRAQQQIANDPKLLAKLEYFARHPQETEKLMTKLFNGWEAELSKPEYIKLVSRISPEQVVKALQSADLPAAANAKQPAKQKATKTTNKATATQRTSSGKGRSRSSK